MPTHKLLDDSKFQIDPGYVVGYYTEGHTPPSSGGAISGNVAHVGFAYWTDDVPRKLARGEGVEVVHMFDKIETGQIPVHLAGWLGDVISDPSKRNRLLYTINRYKTKAEYSSSAWSARRNYERVKDIKNNGTRILCTCVGFILLCFDENKITFMNNIEKLPPVDIATIKMLVPDFNKKHSVGKILLPGQLFHALSSSSFPVDAGTIPPGTAF